MIFRTLHMPRSPYPLLEKHGWRYLDEGPASETPPVVLLHGMLGDVSNWTHTVAALSAKGYRVLAPMLPIYDLPLRETGVQALANHVHAFTDSVHEGPVAVAGNSLGGHVALLFALTHPGRTAALVLSGASGIYEVEMGSSVMRRRDRTFIRERAALTFFDPAHATDDLIEEIYAVVNDRARALRLIRMARAVQAETVTDRLPHITAPTLLVWGREDVITPPDVAETFACHLPNAELHFIDACGHAPMIERPEAFNAFLLDFLARALGIPQRFALSS